MFGRSLNIALTVMSLVIMGLISTSVHYMNRKIARGPDYTVGVYFSEMISDINICSKNCVEIPKAKDMLPVTPEGWTARDFEQSDVPLVTGITPKPDKNNPFSVENIGAAGLFSLAVAQSMYGDSVDRRAKTYIKGDQIAIFSITYRKNALLNGMGGDQLAMMFEMEKMASEFDGTPYVRADDVVFHLQRKAKDGNGRRLVAHLGTQLDLSMLTNADDDAIRAILQGLDIDGLKLMLSNHPSNAGAGGASDGSSIDPNQQPLSGGAGPQPGLEPSCTGEKGFKTCNVGGN